MRLSRAGLRRGVAVLAAGLLVGVSVQLSGNASAAVVRYEAESATIVQGAVSTAHPGFSGSGFVDFVNAPGGYVEWTVNAQSAGPASLTIRFANGSTAARPVDISVNGSVVADERSFPTTGGWPNWQTLSLGVNLAAGPNTVRATGTGAAGGPNIDWLEADTGGAVPGDLQAENATIVQGVVENNHAGFTGTGFVNYNNVVGSYVEWTITGAAAGPATLGIRYANGSGADRPMAITVNGESVTTAAFGATGAWTNWNIGSVTATLDPGTNTVRATATTAGGGPNVDRLDVSTGGGGDTQPPSVPGNLRVTGSTSTSISLAWNASTDNVGVAGYTVREGNTVVASPSGTTATISGLTPNSTHSYTVAARDAAGNESGRSAPTTGTTQPGGGGNTPVAINGQLRVCGTKLCNQHGNQIQLRGMSTHGLQWYPQCVNTASLNALATDWTADHLRLSMYIQEGGYETDPRRFTDLMHRLINEVSSRGMYVIVDWHQLNPGDPNFNLARARTFFAEIAQRHGDKPNVIYDIANEPNNVSWTRVKAYHEQVIPVIRQHDPDNVILLGTHGWSTLGHSDGRPASDVYNNPVNGTNIMYTFHFYAASHGQSYINLLSSASDRIPMFVTEFGTQTASGDGGNNFARSQQYLDLMAAKKISWTNWNFSDDFRSGAVFTPGTCPGGPFTGSSRLKAAGSWIKQRIQSPPDNFPTN